MASVLQPSPDLEHELKSAARLVHFGDAASVTEPETLWFPVDAMSAEESPRALARHGLIWSAVVHGVAFLILFSIAGIVRRYQDVRELDAIRATLSDRTIIDDEVLVPPGEEIILQQSSGPAARQTVIPSSITEITSEENTEFKIDPAEFAPAIGADGDQEQGLGTGGTEGFRYQKPNGGQAVTEGSFTVWTEPPDPFPNQPYYIVVQIRVPEELEAYPKSDLSVEVLGSDTFYLKLPDPRRGFSLLGTLPVIDNKTQLVIPIPGAPSLVRDVIRIESREILNEKQTLQIEF